METSPFILDFSGEVVDLKKSSKAQLARTDIVKFLQFDPFISMLRCAFFPLSLGVNYHP